MEAATGMTHDDIKQQMIWAGKVLVAEGQDDFTRGHISFRLPDAPSRFFMKPHSIGLDEITLENILTIDLDGNVVAGAAKRHSEVYHPLGDFQGAPRYPLCDSLASALCHRFVGERPPDALLQPAGGAVPQGAGRLHRYDQPDTHAATWAPLSPRRSGPHRAVLLKNHGVAVAGATIAEAVIGAIMLEKAAMVQLIAEAAGDVAPEFPSADIEKLQARHQPAGAICGEFRLPGAAAAAPGVCHAWRMKKRRRVMKRISIGSLLLAVAITTCAAPAAAQETYPNRTIKILVGIPAGGAPDVVARLIGRYLSESIGQPVVIENRTGVNGNIAGNLVAKASARRLHIAAGRRQRHRHQPARL